MEKSQRVLWVIVVAAVLFSLCIGTIGGLVVGGVAGFLLGRSRVMTVARVQQPGELWPSPEQQLPPPVSPQVPSAPLPQGVVGALVVTVLPRTPAERAGLQSGDIIVAVNDEPVGPGRPLQDLIAQYRPDDRVTLVVLRGNEQLRLEVHLAENPAQPNQGYLGVRVQNLGEQPGQRLP
jgi:membrane-associated protease RseP (regulator of RpoE activity)